MVLSLVRARRRRWHRLLGTCATSGYASMVHGETALLAKVAQEIRIGEAILGEDQGFPESHRVVFPNLRVADYRASIHDLADFLLQLMHDEPLRKRLGAAGRERVVAHYDYRSIAQRLVDILGLRLGIS